MSDRVPEKESLQLSGTKGSPLTPSQTLNSVPEGKPALPSPAIMQKESVLDPKAPTVLKRIMRSPAVRLLAVSHLRNLIVNNIFYDYVKSFYWK